MQYRKYCLIMVNIKKEIKYHMNNFKDTWKDNIKEDIVFIKIFIHR